MTMTDRDKRALKILAPVAVLILGWYFLSSDETPVQVVAAVTDIPSAEKRLARLRQLSAAVPGKEHVFAQAKTELETRESGLIQAETAAQAQAQLLQVLRRLARAQTPPVDLRNTEMGQVKSFGEQYGEVAVSANFDCGIEQLLTLLAELTSQKEAIGTTELRVGAANPKSKTMPVRLTIAGLVRHDLVPEKKGTAAF
jgi:hypothetical protein